jgi:hypothetical protein
MDPRSYLSSRARLSERQVAASDSSFTGTTLQLSWSMAGAATGLTLPPEDLRRSLDESVHIGVTRRIEQIPAGDRAAPSQS